MLEVEPTRALGHGHSDNLGSRFLAPMRRPEIMEWTVPAPVSGMVEDFGIPKSLTGRYLHFYCETARNHADDPGIQSRVEQYVST